MSKVLLEEQSLHDIGDAIRTKKSTSDTYKPREMAAAVLSIPTGSTPTLVTKTITENGTYSASSDNADGFSAVTVDVASSGGGALEPFDTYEFNVPSDINYQDETGTGYRTLATLDWHQAMYDKITEYSSLTKADHPFLSANGDARVLFSVQPKNPSAILVADSTYAKVVRKDKIVGVFRNAPQDGGAVSSRSPFWRARWEIKPDGTYDYSGSFNVANDATPFEIGFANNNKLTVTAKLGQYSSQMVSAGDYVIKLYDVTWTVL